MNDRPSLFAQKLRDWRTRNGTHGRVTQEMLAEILGISTDAIGKYERSVSFIRGDLEHRLNERLGWDRADILACREDWEARQQRPIQNRYQLLDDTRVDRLFGGSWNKAIIAMIEMVEAELGRLPDELAASVDVFRPIYETYPECWSAILQEDRIVAKWALPLLTSEDETLFRQGRLIEGELTADRIRRPILPGHYFGYCPALVISKRHEAAATLLVSSFAQYLENLAERDILLHGIGTVTCSSGGVQVCHDLGMNRLCDYCVGPTYGVWELPGAAIADSIFARRSPFLRRCYSQAFEN